MKKILIVVGSTRDNRKSIHVANWVLNESKAYKGDLSFEIADLKEIDLEYYNEPGSPRKGKSYQFDKTRLWSSIVDSSDGIIFVTPEYNGSYTGALKDAVDYLYHEWVGKAVGIVGYGSSGAKRAVKNLQSLLNSFKVIYTNEVVGINDIWDALDENKNIKNQFVDGEIQILFHELEKIIEKKHN